MVDHNGDQRCPTPFYMEDWTHRSMSPCTRIQIRIQPSKNKINKKNLDFYIFATLTSLDNDVKEGNYSTVINKQNK